MRIKHKSHFNKFNTLLLSFCLFCNISAAKSYSQSGNITIKVTNSSVKQLFSEIEKNTDYSILYERGIVDNKVVSVDAQDLTVEELLNKVLPQVGLTYKVNNKQIVIVPKEEPATNQQSNPAFTLTGIVTDNTGEPLIGAHVVIKGTSDGVITDVDGKFSIRVSKGLTLTIKSLGYRDVEALVTDEKTIKVVMYEDVTELQDVVVVGYGTQKKASLVGSVSSVKAAELKVPSTRLSNSFAGRLSGVIAVQRSGEPGSNGSDFWIRGISTFNGSRNPLIVIDGVEASKGDLNNLDPEVIESFSILKDATATALYGTRGANGVMIITTKRGRNIDKPIINARFETTMLTPTSKPKTVDAVTYMNMYNEALRDRRGNGLPYSEEKIQGTAKGLDPLLYPNVDWYNEMFNDRSFSEKGVFNIRGGGSKVDYFMNVSINHEAGLMRGRSKEFYSFNNNINLWRYNFQNNININVTPSTSIALRLNTQLYDYNGPYTSVDDLYGMVMNSNRVDFPIVFPNEDRRNLTGDQNHYLWGGKTGGIINSGFYNPMARMATTSKSQFESTITANLEINQKLDFILPGLSINAIASFKNWSKTERWRTVGWNTYTMSDYSLNEQDGLYDYKLQRIGNLQETSLITFAGVDGDRRIYLEGRIHYDKTFNSVHNVAAMLLYTQDEFNVNYAGGNNFSSNDILYKSLPKRKQGFAGRFSYGYDNRYLAEVNFGYNGSENFAKNNRFGFFPSVALGYNISEESYWDYLRNVVSHLKIRGSYGLVGNDQIGDTDKRFLYLEMINLYNRGFVTGVEQDHSAYGPSYTRLRNNGITWEIGKKLNLGIDLQLFGDINIMFDWFREIRENIFLNRQTIPNYVGTGNIEMFGNLGKVKNHGFDFSIDYNKQITKDFFLSFKSTLTYAKNKILEYDEPSYMQYPSTSRVGSSIEQLYMYIADRLFIDEAEIANSPNQQLGGLKVSPGDIKYLNQPDRNGNYDNVIDGNDRVYTGHPTVPEIVYGFGPSMQWKNLDLSVFFQGTARSSLMMSDFHPFGTSSIRNVLQFIADDYWSKTNPNIYAAYPRLSQTDSKNNQANSTYWLRDASFLKLKNAEIGYTIRFNKERNMRIYLNGSNLLTFSKFKLWDPEQGGGAGFKYPTTREFNIGIQVVL